MEGDNQTKIRKLSVHHILAHSYSVYLFFFLVGVCLDLIFNLKVFNQTITIPFGLLFLIFATFLVFWAQKTSRNLNKENITKETFCKGPYSFTRIPTSFGLFFLVLGFGLINNDLFIVLSAPIAFIVSKITFIKKQEEMLAEKYGTPYLEYKKLVKF